jgi:uncharacterized protein with FMN-binding domain
MGKRLRPIAVLFAVACLSVVVCAASQSAGLGAPGDSREIYAAPADDFQKGRQLLLAGDSKRLRKDFAGARKCYEDAANAFQTSGRQKFIVVAEQMIELCKAMPIDMKKLKDGTYEGTDKGYVADITVSVEIKSGRIKTLKLVSQKENKPLKSLDVVPKAIMSRQSPSVDVCTSATITSCAVMSATVRALQKAAPDAQE